MKKLFTIQLLFAAILMMNFAACKNAGEDIKVVVDMNIMKYSTLLHIGDETGAAPQNITLAMGGASGNDIYEIAGKKVFTVKDGIITLGLSPSVTPTATKEVNYTVTIAAPGYKSMTVAMAFKNGEMQQMVNVTMEKITTNTATPTTPVVVTPVTTTPVTTNPVTTTPVTTTPVTTTPVTTTPVTTTPVTTTPVTTTPVTTTPVTTTPVTTTPVTTTPVTTNPVTTTPVTTTPVTKPEPTPVRVALDFTGTCANKANLKVRPSLYVFYRKKDSGAFQFLGYMKDGHLDANLALGVAYDYQITYGGQNYVVTGRLADTSFQSNFDMGSAICATF